MAETRLNMRNQVIYMIGNRPELNADADGWVERAYQHITQAVEFPEAFASATRTTTVGVRYVSLPSDYFSVYGVRNNTSDKRMVQSSRREYDQFAVADTGPVERYNIENTNVLNIHPTPTSVETIALNYRKFFAAMGTDATAHLLPTVWDQAIVELAAVFGFNHTNDIERARYYKGSVRALIQDQQKRLAMDLYDRDEAITPIGLEI